MTTRSGVLRFCLSQAASTSGWSVRRFASAAPLAADADNLEEMQDLLERLDESDEATGFDDATRSLRFDLCDACRQRFVKNPLGLKNGKQLDFSNN